MTLDSLKTRAAAKAFEGKEDEGIWFGTGVFTLFNLDINALLSRLATLGGVPNRPRGPYYCSAGPEK